jgi:hypothetical protein
MEGFNAISLKLKEMYQVCMEIPSLLSLTHNKNKTFLDHYVCMTSDNNEFVFALPLIN